MPEEALPGSHGPLPEADKLASGVILLAKPSLGDPNFSSSAILICHYNQDGAYGLVLNRPSHMPVSEVFNGVTVREKSVRRIYIGGPVQTDELQILQVTDKPVAESFRISERVYLGGRWTDLEQILSSPNSIVRLFLGYSGWGAGQLEAEVQEGAWEIYSAPLEKLLLGPEEPWYQGLSNLRNYLRGLVD